VPYRRKKLTFAISSPDEFLYNNILGLYYNTIASEIIAYECPNPFFYRFFSASYLVILCRLFTNTEKKEKKYKLKLIMMREDVLNTDVINYKKKYQALKKKMKLLVYEQECFLDELRKSQRKLLKVTRDRSFLLDRLLQYEHLNDTSSDSESTASSDSEIGKDNKKRKPGTFHVLMGTSSAGGSGLQNLQLTASGEPIASLSGRLGKEPPKKKPKIGARKVPAKSGSLRTSVNLSVPAKRTVSCGTLSQSMTGVNQPPRVVLSREEIERNLDLKHSSKPQFLSIDMTSHSLPDDIFSHDNSNQDTAEHLSDSVKIEVEDTDLVIDMA